MQCWPVLGSTYGSGSLAEQGYSIASGLRASTPLPKFIIPMIEPELSDNLTNKVARKESLRARELAAAHLALNASPNVYVVDSLEEMLEVSITLHGVAKSLVELSRSKNPAFKRFMEGHREGSICRRYGIWTLRTSCSSIRVTQTEFQTPLAMDRHIDQMLVLFYYNTYV